MFSMHTKTVVRFYQTIKPHSPSIRFRYGVPEITDKSAQNAPASAASAVHVLENFQLPAKFQRATLNEAEINAINSGGAE